MKKTQIIECFSSIKKWASVPIIASSEDNLTKLNNKFLENLTN